jgi:hypothetical protein
MIISDHLDDVKNPVNGKIYDSKSSYYQAVKDAGCVIVGNEAENLMSTKRQIPSIGRDAVARAAQKLKQGYKPAPLGKPTKTELKMAGLDK